MNDVWNGERLTRFHSFELAFAVTWGSDDVGKRRQIRQAVLEQFPRTLPNPSWWAFRIHVEKCGSGRFDIENVPKLIIDSFCREQIEKDALKEGRPKGEFGRLGLYSDDTIDYARMIQVSGERKPRDRTRVEIFGCMR